MQTMRETRTEQLYRAAIAYYLDRWPQLPFYRLAPTIPQIVQIADDYSGPPLTAASRIEWAMSVDAGWVLVFEFDLWEMDKRSLAQADSP